MKTLDSKALNYIQGGKGLWETFVDKVFVGPSAEAWKKQVLGHFDDWSEDYSAATKTVVSFAVLSLAIAVSSYSSSSSAD